MYKPTYFSKDELFPPEIISVLPDELIWKLIPENILKAIDATRDLFNEPLYVNGKGAYNRGLRSAISTVGKPTSSHRGCREGVQGIDFHFGADEAKRQRFIAFIKENYKSLGIIRIENPEVTKGWLHCEYSDKPLSQNYKLKIFNP